MGAEHSSSSPSKYPPDNEAGPSKPRPPPLPIGQNAGTPGPRTSINTANAGPSTASSRRRPTPLNLSAGLPTPMGMDEELAAQRTADGTMFSPIVIVSESGDESDTMSERLHELSNLRSAVQRNLIARPIASASASSGPSQAQSPALLRRSAETPPRSTATPDGTLSTNEVLSRLRSPSQTLVLDVRPLGSYLASHLRHSVSLSIPTLIFKRLRKPGGAKLSWDTLDNFISTPEGKEVWRKLDKSQAIEVVIVGEGAGRADNDVCTVLKDAMASLVGKDHVHVLHGGFDAVRTSPEAAAFLVPHGTSQPVAPPAKSKFFGLTPPTSLFRPKSAPVPDDPRHFAPPPPIPASPLPQRSLSHQASMPSMRQGIAAKRNLPSLQVQTDSTRKGPQMAVNVQPAVKSAYSGVFPQNANGAGLLRPSAARLDADAPKTPLSGSFQALCLAQSQQGTPAIESEAELSSATGATARPFVTSPYDDSSMSGHGRYSGFGGHVTASGSSTARNGSGPFIVSTILPNFLYLGPEITSESEVQALKALGVERILNVALECNDDAGLDLRNRFGRYVRLPLRDIIEESGMARGMRDACDFIDDARLHSSPTYVHCRAGKSRSVTVVLAYLIHANAWTLKTSYAYVAERRKGISPNIGFVAELMEFEEAELGLKQSGGVHGDDDDAGGDGAGAGGNAASAQVPNANGDLPVSSGRAAGERRQHGRFARESMPPTWGQSLDSMPRKAAVPLGGSDEPDARAEGSLGRSGRSDDRGRDEERVGMGGEREVRKNGQWVHQRRAPVDRTTLQPGRRVSKAGLESLRSLAATTDGPSWRETSPPVSSQLNGGSKGGESATPGVDGRIQWL